MYATVILICFNQKDIDVECCFSAYSPSVIFWGECLFLFFVHVSIGLCSFLKTFLLVYDSYIGDFVVMFPYITYIVVSIFQRKF
jgi:hypothetical protein